VCFSPAVDTTSEPPEGGATMQVDESPRSSAVMLGSEVAAPPPPPPPVDGFALQRLSEGFEQPQTDSARSRREVASVGNEPAVPMLPGPPPPPLPEDLQAAVLARMPPYFVSDPVTEQAGPSSARAGVIISESRASYDASEILIEFDQVGPEATPQVAAAVDADVAEFGSFSTGPARAASFLSGHTLEPDAVARAGWRPDPTEASASDAYAVEEAGAHSSDDEEVTSHTVDDEAHSSLSQQQEEAQVEEGEGRGERRGEGRGAGSGAKSGAGSAEEPREEKVAVLLVLGALQRWPHGHEQELQKRLERKVRSKW
jgi:hypothetical protein